MSSHWQAVKGKTVMTMRKCSVESDHSGPSQTSLGPLLQKISKMNLKATFHGAAVHVATGFQKYVHVEWFIAHETHIIHGRYIYLSEQPAFVLLRVKLPYQFFFFFTLITSLYSMGMEYLCSQKVTLQLFF